MSSEKKTNKLREYEFEAAGVRLTVMTGVFPMFSAEFPQPAPTLHHTHSWYEMFCAVEDPITLCFEDRICQLAPGQAIIIPPGIYHYAVFADPNHRDHAFHFSVQRLQHSDTAATIENLLVSYVSIPFPVDATCMHLVGFLSQALEARKSILCGTYLLALLLGCAECTAPREGDEAEPVADNKVSRIYKIEQALYTHYTGQLPIKLLAQELHLSQRQVSRIIRQHYGTSYRSKNKDLRMQSAARRLQNGETIAQVAAAEGYSSISAFYAAFRRTFGITPAEYRKQNG